MKWIVIGLVVVIAVAVGAWWYEGYSAESALLKQPVYRVLKKHERALFDELVAEYRVYQRDEERPEQFINFANSRDQPDRDPRAGACLAGVGAGAGAATCWPPAKQLQGKPGDACFRFWFPQVSGPPDIAQVIDARAQAHTLDLMGEVIRSAAENPVPQPGTRGGERQPGRCRQRHLRAVRRRRADAGARRRSARRSRQGVHHHHLGFYERVLQLPPDQASALIRVDGAVR